MLAEPEVETAAGAATELTVIGMSTLPARPVLAHPPDLDLSRSELRNAVTESLDRSLDASAKFAGELLAALPRPPRTVRAPVASTSGVTLDDLQAGAGRRRDARSSAPHDPHRQQQQQQQHTPAGISPHVHFRTSTPVRTPNGGTETQGGGSSSRIASGGRSAAAPRLSGLPGVGSFSSAQNGTARPRDSLASVFSVGAVPSSPVVSHDLAYDPDDEHMQGDNSVGGGQEGATMADAEQREEWRARDKDEQDQVRLAQAYFRNHELLRAAHVLRDCDGPKARWTRSYAKFLAGEKRLQEEAGELLGAKDRPRQNVYTQELLEEFASYERGFLDNDGFLLYLKALLLLSLSPTSPDAFDARPNEVASDAPNADLRLAALEVLVNSVQAEPYNWSAWLKIAECLDGPEELEATLPFLPSGYPLLFFYLHCSLEMHSATEGLLDIVDELEDVFGTECSAVSSLRALVYYHMREFDESLVHFTALRKVDPYRLDDLDILSNILYVSEKRAELATLAQEYMRVDRVRPETCCLVGNYFSLRRDHEKAITYFRRALKLDRGYLSAWTLMGHEYVEIKNTNAAIASYRRAVDVNRKDYRAWYGLGQAYELLGEPFYAINYYQRATALRPYDARMWSALATSNEKLKRVPDAIQCHQRALLATESGDGSDIALRIGKLYAALGQGEYAAAYHRRALNEGLRAGLGTVDLGKIYLWLAKWEMRRGNASQVAGGASTRGDLDKAEDYLRTLEATQEFREDAKALLKELEVQLLSRD